MATHFDAWLHKFSAKKGEDEPYASESEQLALAKRLILSGADSAFSSQEPILSCQNYDPNKIASSKGIPVGWFLKTFVKIPELQRIIAFGCPLWFVRNVCVPELLRCRGQSAGALVEHRHLFVLDDDVNSSREATSAGYHGGGNSSNDRNQDHDEPAATRFISYTGSYTFKRFVEMMKQLDDGECVWVDFFCVDQFAWQDEHCGEDFRSNFIDHMSSKIRTIGHTMLFLDRYDQPMTSIGKIWVLWEIYSTVNDEAAELEVMLHPLEHDKFWEEGFRTTIDTSMSAISAIDVDKATAWRVEDRVVIFERMQNERGVHHVNRKVCSCLREWFLTSGYKHVCDWLTIRNEISLAMCNNLGVLLCRFGRTTEAEELHRLTEKAIDLYSDSHSDDEEESLHLRATSLHNRGKALADMGRSEEAEPLLRRSIELRSEFNSRRVSVSPRQLLASKSQLGWLLCKLERIEEARELMVAVVDEAVDQYGWSDADAMESIQILATVLQCQGRHKEAEAMYNRCLDEILAHKGPRSSEAIASLAGLASALKGGGNPQGCEKILSRIHRTAREVYGDDHIAVLYLALRLVQLNRELGHQEEVEHIFINIQAQLETEDGEASRNPEVLQIMQQQARLLADGGNFEQAESLLRTVLLRQEAVLPSDHMDILESRYILGHGILTMRSGRTAEMLGEAEKIIAQLVRLGEHKLGSHNEQLLEWLNAHADVLLCLERYNDAETIFRASLACVLHIFGQESIPAFSTYAGLSSSLQKQGKYDEAREFLVTALDLGWGLLGPEHPIVEKLAGDLAIL